MNKRIKLLKKEFDFEIGETGIIKIRNTVHKELKPGEAGDSIHCTGWTYIKMDKGGSIDGAYTEGIDYEIKHQYNNRCIIGPCFTSITRLKQRHTRQKQNHSGKRRMGTVLF